MNGNRLTHIHTLSLDDSAHPTSSLLRQGLDYYGRREGQSGNGAGGDFFDFISRPGANLGVCMGAAEVPGADSALMASGLENLLYGLSARADARPALIVESLNRSVCGAPGDNCYASLFYATVDPLRRQLSYVNAGHEPALLLRKRQNRAIILESTGAILGLTQRSSYGQRTIPLEPGDLLAVFSESVAEAAGFAGVLGVLRRFERAHAADLVEEILRATERHAGWGVPNQTVAVVRFTGMAEAISDETETELAFAAA